MKVAPSPEVVYLPPASLDPTSGSQVALSAEMSELGAQGRNPLVAGIGGEGGSVLFAQSSTGSLVATSPRTARGLRLAPLRDRPVVLPAEALEHSLQPDDTTADREPAMPGAPELEAVESQAPAVRTHASARGAAATA